MDTCSRNIAGNLSTSIWSRIELNVCSFSSVLICRLRWRWWRVVIQPLPRRGDLIMFVGRLSIAVLHDSILMVSTRRNANPRILLEAFLHFHSTVDPIYSPCRSLSRPFIFANSHALSKPCSERSIPLAPAISCAGALLTRIEMVTGSVSRRTPSSHNSSIARQTRSYKLSVDAVW